MVENSTQHGDPKLLQGAASVVYSWCLLQSRTGMSTASILRQGQACLLQNLAVVHLASVLCSAASIVYPSLNKDLATWCYFVFVSQRRQAVWVSLLTWRKNTAARQCLHGVHIYSSSYGYPETRKQTFRQRK